MISDMAMYSKMYAINTPIQIIEHEPEIEKNSESSGLDQEVYHGMEQQIVNQNDLFYEVL